LGPFVITSHIFEYVYILLPLLVGALGPGFLTEQPDGAEELFLDFPADTFDILHAALVCGKYGAQKRKCCECCTQLQIRLDSGLAYDMTARKLC
jgi:hypothetical protein